MAKKTGFTCGAFDLLHTGHALMFEECKEHCDYLIVGVQSDPSIDRPEKNKPVQDLSERLIMVKSIKWIDEVYVYETEDDLLRLISGLMPDVRFVGADWKGKSFTGNKLPVEIIYNTRDHTYSSSSLRERVFLAEYLKRKIDTPDVD